MQACEIGVGGRQSSLHPLWWAMAQIGAYGCRLFPGDSLLGCSAAPQADYIAIRALDIDPPPLADGERLMRAGPLSLVLNFTFRVAPAHSSEHTKPKWASACASTPAAKRKPKTVKSWSGRRPTARSWYVQTKLYPCLLLRSNFFVGANKF